MNEQVHANVEDWSHMHHLVCLIVCLFACVCTCTRMYVCVCVYRRGLVHLQLLVVGGFSFFFFLLSRRQHCSSERKEGGSEGLAEGGWDDGTEKR